MPFRFLDWIFPPARVPVPSPNAPDASQVIPLVSLARHSRPALAEDRALTAFAQRWAERIAAAGQLAHSGTGYECVGYGYPDARAAVAGWMASPAHRVILLNPALRLAGAGVALSPEGVPYWCLYLAPATEQSPR